ncbi:hypothetical protein A2955_00650 [Candidatus Woesebacteria bacterium RIFCSPLOWO2_01_FULL_37_19]|uniref:Uncharacterized protein n=2 Tax=Candidatus Woeseibacteriota TaxID=1752722 RepID=A0A1F8BDB5_9BACT|nr:MAG: hypothetical protein A2771_01645 [Candidatus Woesebacteria bacterium RIFCSPHIGHO2_01_FULL_38_26b]OGM61338.1 MAG: hypothetical protein A2955_00650 [Candidatus Woesebacteria bacterium RIFCSPLOWO2_01_FULL_37_19]
MVATPEREKPQSIEPIVKEVPETPEQTPAMTEAGVQSVATQVTAQVTDDTTGQHLIQTPATQTVTITIPTTEDQLSDWAKGPAESSLTWLAFFWLRIVKKALYFGWKVITKGGVN